MKMPESLTIEGGKITLPDDVLSKYGLTDHTPVRLIETRTGILIVPLTDEPMNEALAAEIEQWQAAGAESLAMFPYDEGQQS
jgi:bifunctional DNA-binding transcriptional regulator/antitoxin component of YhaV-PrlF toxin-antitoxin module